ncbi:hypothetical protein PMIT1313_01888 [Prochlorococcus marinus str. MIT 1313]|nr:hypothetical protein [Prochlorococcus marinus]KZR68276.1 hypothetical protein PMIT1313_01888 [Prochlorococcus marinus str. MIT 1313]KZR71485.1 hypothetical protein PMIT1318_02638 [Prochlorococcus marinus str. MIT 1318]
MRAGHALLMQPQCPICRAAITSDAECSKPCLNCCMKLDLPADGLRGFSPLNWRALGWYEGHLRRLLLSLRRNRKLSAIHALAKLLTPLVPINAVLVPIPSWKSLSRANPVPQLLASGLCRPCHGLLRRRHATVGQHHLDRQLHASEIKFIHSKLCQALATTQLTGPFIGFGLLMTSSPLVPQLWQPKIACRILALL